ncbi:MAG: 4-(cytidine 5'-diphospho)-2-C-methyl-D-erythritol kinase [Bacteroidota bacterium]
MICFPNAKINLGLHVLNKREDGFHNIETVFYPVNLCDMLEIVKSVKSTKKVDFFSDGLPISGNTENNLVVKAYNLLDKDFNLDPVKIFLYKKIPMGAGLGGGSSDAAFALKLLNDIFLLGLNNEQLKNYASQLGSDCAFFIENIPSYVLGRGNELEDFDINLSDKYIVLLNPNIHSDTALAYKNVNRRGAVMADFSLKNLLKQPIINWKDKVENDFEKSVFQAFPVLNDIKQKLYDSGALYASMSGSGSSIFGIFDANPKLDVGLNKYIIYKG